MEKSDFERSFNFKRGHLAQARAGLRDRERGVPGCPGSAAEWRLYVCRLEAELDAFVVKHFDEGLPS